MKIVRFSAENIKRLRAVEIEPDGSIVRIAGKNEAGKSSVLDAIAMALGGADAIPPEALRRGAERGRVEVDLGDLLVTRTFTKTGTALVVAAKDGARYPSPQAVLDRLVGSLTFDPLEFERQPTREQGETLRRLLGLDFSDLDDERGKVFQRRTDINRDLKAARVRADDLPFVEGVPADEIEVSGLVEEVRAAFKSEQALERAEVAVERAEETVRRRVEELESAKRALAAAQQELATVSEGAAKARATLVFSEPLSRRLAEANAINAKVRANRAHSEARARVESLALESAGLTSKINDLDGERLRRLQAAPVLVPGLGLNAAGEVTFDDLPFVQAASSVRLRVSVALGLAANPKLRIMLIRDGSLLDAAHLAMIGRMAEEAGAQLWVEVVQEATDGSSVYIEDGSIVSAPPRRAKRETAAAPVVETPADSPF